MDESMNVVADRSMTMVVPRAKIASSVVWSFPTVARSCSPPSATTHSDESSLSTPIRPTSRSDMTTLPNPEEEGGDSAPSEVTMDGTLSAANERAGCSTHPKI